MSFTAITIYNLAKSDPAPPAVELLSRPQKVALGIDCTILVAIIVLTGIVLANTLLNLNLPGLAHMTNTTAYILVGSAIFLACVDFTLLVIHSCQQWKKRHEQLNANHPEGELSTNQQQAQTELLEQTKKIADLEAQLAAAQQERDRYANEIATAQTAHALTQPLQTAPIQSTISPELQKLQTEALAQAKKITELQTKLTATEQEKAQTIQHAATARDTSNVAGRTLVEAHDKKISELKQNLEQAKETARKELEQAQLKAAEQSKQIAELQAQADGDKASLKEVGMLHLQLAAREAQTKNLTSQIARLENDLVTAKYELYKATHNLDDTDCVKSDTVGIKICEDDRTPYIEESEAVLCISSAQAALMRKDPYFSAVASGMHKHDNDPCLVDNLKIFLHPKIHKLSVQAETMGSILLEKKVKACISKFEPFFVEINLSKDPTFLKNNLVLAHKAVERVLHNLEYAVIAEHKVLTTFWLQALESYAPLFALIDSFDVIAAGADHLTCAHYLHEMMFNCLLENATNPIAQAFVEDPANKGLFKIETLKVDPFLKCVNEKKDNKFDEEIDPAMINLFFDIADLASLKTVESLKEDIFNHAIIGRECIGQQISARVDAFGCLLHHQSTFGRGGSLVKCGIDDKKAKLIDYTALGNPSYHLGAFGKEYTLFRSVSSASGGGINILYRDGCEKELAEYLQQAYCLKLADFQKDRNKYFTKK